MTAFEKHEQAGRNMMRLARVTRTGPLSGLRGNANQRRRLKHWMRQYERQLSRSLRLDPPPPDYPHTEEAPEGMCPSCYHGRGEGVPLEYNERTECDECPMCDYYQ